MSALTLARFDGGLDVRRGNSVSDANKLRALLNASINTGQAVQKRPCLKAVATLEGGTVGLKAAGGVLNTFYESGSVAHANTLFKANKLAHPTLSQKITKAHFADFFLGNLYAAVQYADGSIWHHYLDGAPDTHISDVNCPQTNGVIKVANKMWAIKGDVVRFCAAGAPRDWTTASNAGFLPVGRSQSGTSQSLALGTLKKQLAVFFIDGVQIWNVDEDPANNALNSSIAGIGTQYPASPASFHSDVFFLSDIGFRSVTVVTTNVDNFQDSDVGSPIDDLITPQLPTLLSPTGIYVPGLGQYWCFIGNTAWIYTTSRSAKLACWSQYDFPIAVDAVAALNNKAYIRSGDKVYELAKGVYTDDGVAVPVRIEMPYVDAKEPGNLKQWTGADFVGKGTPSMGFKYEQNEPDKITEEYPYTGDTSTGAQHPVEVTSTNIAPVITHSANEDFRMDALRLYYNSLGAV